jgi:ATP-dependent Clp protease ATP-binding subunit ClpX
MERKTGARGLRSILEHALLETMYELPAMTGVREVVVDVNAVTEGAQPLFIYEDKQSSVSSGSNNH